MNHLLVTNDFPPKVGGIQSYLWELWRRLPASHTTVLTTAHANARAFDHQQPFRIERAGSRVLVPTRSLRQRIDRLAADVDAGIVLLDPALPLGRLGPALERPYGVVIHGAEVTIPGRIPGLRGQLATVLRAASVVVAAGGYPLREAERAAGRSLPAVVVPPGVDTARFHPATADERSEHRQRFGVRNGARLVVSVSRLVPRKGMDTLIEAAAVARRDVPDLHVLIAGDGRDRGRLQRLIERTRAPVHLLGRVSDAALPSLYAAADVFAMLCRNRWAGLEQEGFGIVFLEAAAAGTPQLAGRSGGSHEAVIHGVTGAVVDEPRSVPAAATALTDLLLDGERLASMASASRERAVSQFTYDSLVVDLQKAIENSADWS